MSTERVFEKNLVMTAGSRSAPSRRKAAISKRGSRAAAAPISTTDAASTPAFETANTEPEASVQNPSQEQIAALAHSYWVARDCQGGSPEEDWLRAEQELRVSQPTVSA